MTALLPKTPPVRDRSHRLAVSKYRCLVCAYGDVIDMGETVSQAAHLSWVEKGRGKGQKVADSLTVPLCLVHHDMHDGRSHKGAMMGETFWQTYHIDPLPVAKMLWERHGPAA